MFTQLRKIYALLLGHIGFRNVVKNAGWLSADQILTSLSAFLVSAWVIRYLGPQEYGLLTYSAAFVVILAPLANLGLSSLLIRDLSSRPTETREILGTSFWLRLGGGVVAYVVSILAAWIVEGPSEILFLCAIIGVTHVLDASRIIDCWFSARLMNRYNFYARGWTIGVVATLRISAILLGLNVKAFAVILALELVVKSVFLFYLGVKNGIALSAWRFSWEPARRLLRDSRFLMFESFVVMVYLRVDQLMLKFLSGLEDVGIYGAATRISGLAFPFGGAISVVVLPILALTHETKGERTFDRRLQAYADLLCLASWPVILGLVVLAPWIVRVLFGTAFNSAVQVLQIHAFMIILMSLSSVRNQWILIKNQTYLSFLAAVVGALFNIALNIFLIPRYGVNGAAFATLVSHLFSVLILFLILPQTRSLGWALVKGLGGLFRIRALAANLYDVLKETGRPGLHQE